MSGRGRLTLASAVATIAAGLSFSAVFDGWSWLPPVVGAIAVVFGVNEAVRRLRIPAPLGPLFAAALVLCYLTLLDARQVAVWGLLPGPAALRMLGEVSRSGFSDIRKLSTPVPTHDGLVMLVVIAMAAVALVVDLLAVTMRRAALAGLPLLAVFAVCTSVAKHGVGWAAFGVATAGYLWLLLADSRDRISRWGRTLGADQGTRITWADQDLAPSPLSALGRRVGASAIAIGVVLPMLLPGLHGGVPKHSGTGGSGSGGHSVETLNPLVNLRAQLTNQTATPLLHYTSSDPQPAYLRLVALDEFDGTSFSPHELQAPPALPVKKGIHAPSVTGPTVTVSVSIGKLGVHWLPVPTQVESLHVGGDWAYDPLTNTVFSARNDTRDTSYTATTVRPDPSPADLEAAPPVDASQFNDDLSLPQMPSDIIDLAGQITANAKTPFDKAIAIQNYLNSSGLYLYDTSVSGSDSTNALENFLIKTKRGFCQQFAASMAVLARIEDIPARVVVGFTRGDHLKDGSWLVTTHDAHAWPELYFSGYGWLPFEPTPRGDGQAVTPDFTRPSSPNGPGPKATNEPEPTPSASRGRAPADLKDLEKDTNGRTAAAAKAHRGSHASLWWVLLALIALALPVPALARSFSRARRWRTADSSGALAHAAWAELRASAIDAGAFWHDGLSPRGAARVLRADVPLAPAAEEALDRLVRAEERARYAADPRSAANRGLPADVELVRAALLARCGRLARWRARILPASTLAAVRAGAGRVADGLDAFDRGAAWLRNGVLRLAPHHG